MLRRIKAFISRIVNFGNELLSDSHSVSLKRFVSLMAFALFTIVVFVSLKKNLTADNVNLLGQALKWLFYIIASGILGVTITDAFTKRD